MTRRPRPSLPPSIHPIEPVSSQPVSVLTHWRISQLRGPTSLRSAACVASTICGKARCMLSRGVHWNERPRVPAIDFFTNKGDHYDTA